MGSTQPIIIVTSAPPPPPPPPPPGGCVAGDTLITCPKGDVRIEDIRPGDEIIGMYGDTVVVAAIETCKPNVERTWVAEAGDHRLVITSNHAMWLRNEVDDWHVINLKEWEDECHREKLLGMIGLDDTIRQIDTRHRQCFGMIFGWKLGVLRPHHGPPVGTAYGLTIKSPGYYANGFLIESNYWEFAAYRGRPWDAPRRTPESEDHYWHERQRDYVKEHTIR